MITIETILNVAVLCLSIVPVLILLVSGIHHRNANLLWKRYGFVSILLVATIWAYSGIAFPNLAALILWGVVSGIVLTIALDIVRLIGVALGTMPMDMPMSFGLRITGLMEEVEKRMMMKMKSMSEMKMPFQMTMFEAAQMMKPVAMQVIMEKNAKGKVMLWGYIWHFLNGIAFGLAYTLLFGTGHWLIALGLGLTIWALMMLVMPGLMMGAQVPKSTFVTALIAHVAMAIPLMIIPPAVLSLEATRSSLLPFLIKLIGL